MKNTLEKQENLDVKQAEIVEILYDEVEGKKTVRGVKPTQEQYIKASCDSCNGNYLKVNNYRRCKLQRWTGWAVSGQQTFGQLKRNGH